MPWLGIGPAGPVHKSIDFKDGRSRGQAAGRRCAPGVALILGGESPLHVVEIGSASLGKGVHREVESEGSR